MNSWIGGFLKGSRMEWNLYLDFIEFHVLEDISLQAFSFVVLKLV